MVAHEFDYETTGRLLDERLDTLLAVGWLVDNLLTGQTGGDGSATEQHAQFVRLVSAARSLQWRHAVMVAERVDCRRLTTMRAHPQPIPACQHARTMII